VGVCAQICRWLPSISIFVVCVGFHVSNIWLFAFGRVRYDMLLANSCVRGCPLCSFCRRMGAHSVTAWYCFQLDCLVRLVAASGLEEGSPIMGHLAHSRRRGDRVAAAAVAVAVAVSDARTVHTYVAVGEGVIGVWVEGLVWECGRAHGEMGRMHRGRVRGGTLRPMAFTYMQRLRHSRMHAALLELVVPFLILSTRLLCMVGSHL
jgi:hypothetical protein